MEIIRQQGTAWVEGADDRFDGQVQLQRILNAEAQPFLRFYRVAFATNARTHWHRHNVVQFLYILEGRCLLGEREGELQRLEPGDIARIEPGSEHFHGADKSGPMEHLAIMIGAEAETIWLEPVGEVSDSS